MPYLIGRHTCLLHIPKTGGIWARQACAAAGLEWSRYGDQHTERPIPPSRVVLAVVREPTAWLRSYWCYGQSTDWRYWVDAPAFAFHLCRHGDFSQFVETYLGRFKGGGVGRMFDRYLEHADIVLHAETLSRDLTTALRCAGEEFDASRLAATPRTNVSQLALVDRAEYAPGQLERVHEAEHEFIWRWYGPGCAASA